MPLRILSVIILAFFWASYSQAQYDPLDANVKALYYFGGSVSTTNDSVDTWNDLTTGGLNPTQATPDSRPVLGSLGITFAGTDDYLAVGSPGNVRPGLDDFSIEGRIFMATYATGNTVWSLFSTSTNRVDIYISTSNRIGIYANDAGTLIIGMLTPSSALVNGSTHTWSFTVDRDESTRVYIDGIKVNTAVNAGEAASFDAGSNLHIGRYGGGSSYFTGRMDVLRYSDNVRTQAEVTAFHNWASDTTKYYVDASKGAAANNGRSIITPLVNFDSLNTAGITLDPNDFVYLRTGVTVDDTLIMPVSGTFASVITVTKYDSTGQSGLNPVVSQLNVNSKNYISISSCMTVTNGIINKGTGFLLIGSCAGYENRFKKYPDYTKSPRY